MRLPVCPEVAIGYAEAASTDSRVHRVLMILGVNWVRWPGAEW